ncbi:hypothetical protein GCM10028822_23630 [Hymenobacter terrigena]
MAAINTLRPGTAYEVIREFIDYDKQRHAIGETWTFIAQSFAPYDDGMLLQVQQHGQPTYFRMQWRTESQAEEMDNFTDYVRPL